MDTELASQVRDYIDTAAPPLELAVIAGHRPAPARLPRRGALTAPGRRRTAIAAAAAAAVAAAGILTAVELGSGPAGTSVQLAAMVRRIQAASEAATSPAGHILVTYSLTSASSGSVDYTYSGNSFNAVEHPPPAPGDPSPASLTIRYVSGTTYLFGGPGRARQWTRFPDSRQGQRDLPDPRKILTALRPEAGFAAAGSQVLQGVPTQILRATRLSGLPAGVVSELSFVQSMGPQTLTGFSIWVDRHDDVRQVRLAYHRQGTSVLAETLRFLDIGQPQKIDAPAVAPGAGS